MKSQRNGRLCIGITSNLDRRIKEHNRGSIATSSTINRGPFQLVYREEVLDRMLARKREKYLKSGVGREFLKSILTSQ
ncbi:MAG: GIY-YIG nuclease family protein [Candidatus Sungbacteria bacterium]|nr:GIY-YIG nuclease family protein [Candidatus Sungbacteria bacterium]